MGAEAGEDPNDPPKEGEVVYADARHVLCRRWNWRQDARTASAKRQGAPCSPCNRTVLAMSRPRRRCSPASSSASAARSPGSRCWIGAAGGDSGTGGRSLTRPSQIDRPAARHGDHADYLVDGRLRHPQGRVARNARRPGGCVQGASFRRELRHEDGRPFQPPGPQIIERLVGGQERVGRGRRPHRHARRQRQKFLAVRTGEIGHRDDAAFLP